MTLRLRNLCVWLQCALVIGLTPASASAFCIGWDKNLPSYDPLYYSVSHEYRRAKYVIRAKVIRETWLGEDAKPKPLEPPFQNGSPKPWGFDPYAGAYYDVEVETSFKGPAPPTLRLFSENSTARFWFDVGSEWVLFVTDDTFDPPIGRSLTMDTCGNSEPLSKARALLRDLRELATAPKRTRDAPS
ncbi:MAG: hypothetical protein ACREEB_04420 [Caulobacteraceae bacterium]